MLLAIDVGNTNTVLGLYTAATSEAPETLAHSWRITTVQRQTADELGNLTYRLAARNFNPVMAMAAKTTIAEVEEIVPIGAINPEHVVTPAIFVHRIVQAKGLRYAG